MRTTIFSSFKVLVAAVGCAFSVCAHAAGAKSGSVYNAADYAYADNYTPYPALEPAAFTPPPAGYEPCYISHYGRHGSRYLISKKQYDEPVRLLNKAKEDGELTPYGEDLLRKLTLIADDARERYGELSPLGHEEHRGIARRMHRNFPALFAAGKHVDAKSSTVVRCILSMSEELQTLKSLEPGLDVRCDASEADMKFIIQWNKDLDSLARLKGGEAERQWTAYRDSLFRPTRLLNTIFRNEKYWRKRLGDPMKFAYDYLWCVSQNLCDSELRHSVSLGDLFTDAEKRDIWKFRNAGWYTAYGPSPLHQGRMAYRQRNLVRLIVSEADSILAAQAKPQADDTSDREREAANTTASLRFGHETGILPLLAFLNVNNAGAQYDDMTKIADNWRGTDFLPMGSNLQLVFYRNSHNPKADILVKVLLQEREARLADIKPLDGSCYYRWRDLRKHCLAKLAQYKPVNSKKQ